MSIVSDGLDFIISPISNAMQGSQHSESLPAFCRLDSTWLLGVEHATQIFQDAERRCCSVLFGARMVEGQWAALCSEVGLHAQLLEHDTHLTSSSLAARCSLFSSLKWRDTAASFRRSNGEKVCHDVLNCQAVSAHHGICLILQLGCLIR